LRELPLNLLVAIAGFLIDMPVLLVANHKLKKGAIGYW
jgi:hypothetical protein